MDNRTIKKLSIYSSGNISILTMTLVALFAFLFLMLGDFYRIFTARTVSKSTANAVALALSQNLLFMESKEIPVIAKKIALDNNCSLTGVKIKYDEVIVLVEKNIDFVLLDIIGINNCRIRSVSKSKVIYPWDDSFGSCKQYRFEY